MSRKKINDNVQVAQTTINTFGVENFMDVCNLKKNKCRNEEMYWQTSDYNSRLFMMFRAEIMGMALNRFKWLNLPKTCDERYLELTLLMQGQASIAFPKKQSGVFYSTQMAQIGRPNVYDNPTAWRAIGNNGFNFNVTPKNGVVVWDNRMRYPLMQKINIWARELTDCVRTKQLNRMHQKIPYIFKVPQEMRDQAINIYKQMAGGEPAIIGTTGLEAFNPEVWNTEVPYLGEQLNGEMENIWNEIYMCLGIPNQTFKTERMIEDEVRTNRAPSEMVKLDFINCRREAARKLNERFGNYLEEEIRVVWNYDNASDNYDYIHDVKQRMDGEQNG